MATDTSTIPVTIGLDVLEALLDMAAPVTVVHSTYAEIAYNAVEAAKCPSCNGLNISHPEGCGRDPKTGELDGSTIVTKSTVDKYADQRPWDGPFEGEPSELDYETKDHCDQCNSNMDCSKPKKLGTMIHARGATGRVCPVLFLCHDCKKDH